MTNPIPPHPGNPVDQTGQVITDGAAIAYAVADGHLRTGLVDKVIIELKDDWSGGEVWHTRLKVYSASWYGRGVSRSNLTKMTNVVVLGGEASKIVKAGIQARLDAEE